MSTEQHLVDMVDFPPMAGGAPCPMVLAHEHAVSLFYYLQVYDPNWDGTTIRMVDVSSVHEPAAVIRFDRPLWHRLGRPNEEAISAHPLCRLGLYPYTAREVIGSETLRSFRDANRVHPHHSDSMFANDRHFAIAFHDSVFEVIAADYSVENLGPISVVDAAASELKRWQRDEQ